MIGLSASLKTMRASSDSTNGAFRGVVVPEGEHEVRFRYSSTEFTTAFVISASSLAATLLALLIIGVRSRTRDRV